MIGLLVALPVVFVMGHVLGSGVIWNHETGEHFSPLTNWVSDYAYRSPAWPWFIACMDLFAVALAVLSYRVFTRVRDRRPLVWLMTTLLAYGSLKLVEVAVFPVKPPEVTVEELQARLDRGVFEQLRDELEDAYYGVRGRVVPEEESAWDVVRVFQSNTGHMIGIRGVLAAVLLTMAIGIALPLGRRWQVLSAVLIVAALLAIYHARGEYHGLYQRLAFLAIYLWMWLATLTWFRGERSTVRGG